MSKKGENIYKRKDGRWEGRYKYVSDNNVKYKSVYAKNYKECRKKLFEAKSRHEQEKNKVACKICLTVKELFDEWLKNISVKVKKSTLDVYTAIVENHIIPFMSRMRISLITGTYINEFAAEKLNNGRTDGKGALAPKTVQNIVSVLKAAFRYAERTYGIINPAKYIALPRTDKKKLEVLTDDDIKKISNYCCQNEDYFSIVYDLCISTGVRIGELCALKYDDFDFTNGVLYIERTVQRVKNADSSIKNKTTVIIDTPKTSNSVREIPIPDNLLEKLKKFTASLKKGDFIFSSDHKKPFDVRTIQKKFADVLKNCGIKKFKFHILRHTFATRWIRSNFDVKSLSEVLGHASVSTTLALYVHPSAETKRHQINSLYNI